MKRVRFCLYVAAALLLSANASLAEVRITVSKKFARKTVIAIPSFEQKGAAGGTLSKSLAEQLKSDLDSSGYFETVKKQQFVDETDRDDRRAGRINLKEWATLRAEMLVKANCEMRGTSLAMACRLYSMTNGKSLFAQGYTGDAASAVTMVHRMANDIIKAVTGEVGLAGSVIAFASDMSGRKQIYTMELGGTSYRQVTSGKDISLFPAWTPDARSLLFTSYIRGFPEIFMLDLATRNARPLASFPGLNAFADVSPDGREILLTLSKAGNPELYRMSLASGTLTRLTRTTAVEASPCWSPDGSKIAFVSDTNGSPQIYTMDSWGKTAPQRVTRRGSYNTKPAWSPDGDLISYCAREGGSFEIRLVNLKTGVESALPKSGSDEEPSWAPDGRHIVYSVERGRKRDLYIMDVYEQAPTQITHGKGNFSSPAWSPK
ncbi:MAG: Tol-Pal system beta propeller repeat protein TolB [Candidatus Aureabacteria bacterium]|nr:Tol-Pal system beta propeller repeat protein TolB [Candidatus Auribacterota bacterium]